MACARQWAPVPGSLRYLEAIVKSVTVRMGSSVNNVRCDAGFRNVGGDIGVRGDKYA